jgi:hypothetical protein
MPCTTMAIQLRFFAIGKGCVKIRRKDNFIQVFATPVSNVAEITSKPDSFENSYNAVTF